MKNEKVLAVPAPSLWKQVEYTERGLITNGVERLANVISSGGVFLERAAAENDPGHKQIIPYALIRFGDSCFLLRRKSTQNEERLHNKLSVGVGGHINPEEGPHGGDAIQDGLTREVNEELHIASGYQSRLVGLINDDTTDVGRVHLGVLFEIISISPDVRVRETRKMQGAWAPIHALEESYGSLETWSQIVYDSHLRPLLACTAQHQDGH
jgi:predicted NUDIX family phosphoesterase